MELERWTGLCARVGCPDPGPRYADLDVAYSEAHRAYHTWRHVAECLEVFDEAPADVPAPDLVEYAIWLHDVVYRPLRPDNEERSAELAARWLEDGPAPGSVRERARELVLVTRHPSRPDADDARLLHDVDLHILGAAEERYAEYEAQVRSEYRWVPGAVFRSRRAAVLASFLAEPSIYLRPWFRDRFEARARENLERAIARLRGG